MPTPTIDRGFQFYPCNAREARILDTLKNDVKAKYIDARNKGATVSEACEAVTVTSDEWRELYRPDDGPWSNEGDRAR